MSENVELSEATLKSYKTCWKDFQNYCRGKSQDFYAADTEFVMKYFARKSKACGLSRLFVHLSSISYNYRTRGKVSPCDDARVKMMMKGKNSTGLRTKIQGCGFNLRQFFISKVPSVRQGL